MAKFIKGDVVVGKNRDSAPIYLPGFQDGTGNGEGAGAAAFGSANFIAGEVAPLHEGEMGADRPVVFRGRRRNLDPRNAAGMDARAGIVIDGIGLVLPADAPRADARLQEAALREG